MTDRPRLDQLTDDKLDQLYARLDLAEARVRELDGAGDIALSAVRLMQGAGSERDALMQAHAALAEQAGKDQAAIERVRAVAEWIRRNYPGLDHGRRILTALDGTP